MNDTASTSTGSERRRSTRTPCSLGAEVLTCGRTRHARTRLKDAAREGICFLSWEPISPGESVTVSLPELDSRLTVDVIVRRCQHTPGGRYEVGVQINFASTSAYQSLYRDIWELECYRQVVEEMHNRPVNSGEILNQWRSRYRRAAVHKLNTAAPAHVRRRRLHDLNPIRTPGYRRDWPVRAHVRDGRGHTPFSHGARPMADPQLPDLIPVLDSLERAPAIVIPLLREVPAERLRTRPAPGRWSAHEHACHLSVVDPLMLARIERMLAEDRPAFEPYLPGEQEPDDALLKLDLDTSLDQWKLSRASLVERARGLSPDQLARTAIHPEYVRYSIGILLRHLAMHDLFHAYRIEEQALAPVPSEHA